MRRDTQFFLYAVRRRFCLPRHYIIAENYRRFWRNHPWRRLV